MMSDVLVVGGGPAGSSFAITAARRGLSVILLHDNRRLKSWPGEALPAGGGEFFESIFGADIMHGQHESFGTSAAWGSSELIDHHFMAHWSGRGWHLDRTLFDERARERAEAAGVHVIEEKVTAIERDRTGWRVNDRWEGMWLIDASGRARSVVARLGVTHVRLDDQIAIIAIVPDSGGEQVTMVESTAMGWWYSSPLPGGQRVAAFVTDGDLLSSDRTLSWVNSLRHTTHMREVVGSHAPHQIGAFPAGSAYSADLFGEGWVAVGDAAVSVDPLSSQGLVTGVVMAAHAARLLGNDLTSWQDNYRTVLDEHERVRAGMYAMERRWPDAEFWARRLIFVN